MKSPRAGWLLLLTAVMAMSLAIAIVAWSGWLTTRLPLQLEAHATSPDEFAFEPGRLAAPADTAVSLTFANMTQAPHTLVLLPPIDLRSGVIVEPGFTDRLEFTTPGPGQYRFVCSVHEGMAGVLVVE